MSKLVAISFKDDATAFALRSDLAAMQADYLLALDDIVVVTKDEKGKPKLHQPVSLTGAGALSGGWWGTLIGFLFLAPLAGLVIGAGTGALAGKFTDIGIDDRFMRDVAASLEKDEAMVFVLVRDVTIDKVMDGLSAYRGKGRIHTTSLSRRDEDELRKLIEAA